MRSWVSGSSCAHQRILGAVNPGIAKIPARVSMSGMAALICAHCGALRLSFQRIAGRMGFNDVSNNTAPCIWPDNPIPAICFIFSGEYLFRLWQQVLTAVTQSSGTCSHQPCFGWDKESCALVSVMGMPRSSTKTALTADVPISRPRNNIWVGYISPVV